MRPVKANKRMRQLIYIMMVMALLSSCQQKGDKNMTSEELMRKAIVLAEENVDNGGGPFGAVIARNGEIIATGVNRVTAEHDPTAHAEVNAIRRACALKKNFKLEGCVIYSSCEPCPMCLSALYWAGVKRIYYANTQNDADAINFGDEFIYKEIAKPHLNRLIPCIHIEEEHAIDHFKKWAEKADKIEY